MSSLRVLALAGLIGFLLPTVSLAQPLGSFRWQIQPYCNVLSISVVQQGGIYLLDGTDDQCGAPQQASVAGLAFQNPDGTIGFGLTTVTAPGGTPVHIDATITIATLGGTWRDSAGNNGTFVFTPGAGIGGAPRPVAASGIAPGSITTVELAADSVGASELANNSISSAHVLNGSLTNNDFSDPPRAAFAGGDQTVDLTAAAVVVRQVSLTAPATGRVIVNASGYVDFNSAAADHVNCYINDDPVIDSAHHIAINDDGIPASTALMPFAGTRGFTVSAGPFTAYLVCNEAAGVTDINDTALTAIFIPS